MTITRADVEWLSALTFMFPAPEIVAELCLKWLAVDDAPSGETVVSRRGFVVIEPNAYIPAGTYKLVCIDTPTAGVAK